MSDLISRKALLEELEEQDYYGGFLVRLITNAPAINSLQNCDAQGEPVAFYENGFDKKVIHEYTPENLKYRYVEDLTLLYTAPPQPQTVKDALEKAARIVQVKIGHYYPTPLTDAVAEIRALIGKE